MGLLVLLRHGQAAFGQADYDQLSRRGAEQARAAGRALSARGDHFTRVLRGPRVRHALTTEHALLELERAPTPESDPLLDEFADGSEVFASIASQLKLPAVESTDPVRLRAQAVRAYLDVLQRWSRGEISAPGMATAEEFRARVRGWLHDITDTPAHGQRILAVTSAGVIAAVVCEVLQLPSEQLARFISVVLNGSLTEILFTRGLRTLHAFNVADHLPASLRTYL